MFNLVIANGRCPTYETEEKIMRVRTFISLAFAFLLASQLGLSQAQAGAANDFGTFEARAARGSGPNYGGGHHSKSHGGHYANGKGSSHKGGHYKNSRTNDHYGKHK